jgi:hypothetical protein
MSSPVLRVACAVLQSRTESDRANCSLRFLRLGLAPATAKPNLSNSEESRSVGFRPPAYTGPRSDVRGQEHCGKADFVGCALSPSPKGPGTSLSLIAKQ